MGKFEELWRSGGDSFDAVLEKTHRQEKLWASLLGIPEETRLKDLDTLRHGGVLDSGCVALHPPEALVREWGSLKYVCSSGVEVFWVPGYPNGFRNTSFAMLPGVGPVPAEGVEASAPGWAGTGGDHERRRT